MEMTFLIPETKKLRANWRKRGTIIEWSERDDSVSTFLSPSTEYPYTFALRVKGPYEACEEFCTGYGREPDLIDGFKNSNFVERKHQ